MKPSVTPTTTETIDPSALSDVDLEEMFSEEELEEEGDQVEETEEIPDEEKEEESEGEGEGVEKPPDKEEEPGDEELDTRFSEYESKLAKQDGMIAEKQKMIDRQANEIGMLRKQIISQPEPEPELTNDEAEKYNSYVENGEHYNAQRFMQKCINDKRGKSRTSREEHIRAVMDQNERIVRDMVPDIDDLLEDMSKQTVEDGVSHDIANQFARNPYIEEPPVVINLARLVKAKREIIDLKKEIDGLKSKMSGIPDKIKNATTKTRKLKGSVSPSSSKPEISGKDLTRMSDEELLNYYKEL